MTSADFDKWNANYESASVSFDLRPDEWLVECCRDLSPGLALDVACGLGHNAVWLATQGWKVDAIDISPRGLELARQLAEHHGVPVNWICADLDEWQPAPQWYDFISVFRYLDRDRLPQMIDNAVAPGGRLCYETFAADQMLRSDNHLHDARFTLQPGELRRLYPEFEIVEESVVELPDRTLTRMLGVQSTPTPASR